MTYKSPVGPCCTCWCYLASLVLGVGTKLNKVSVRCTQIKMLHMLFSHLVLLCLAKPYGSQHSGADYVLLSCSLVTTFVHEQIPAACGVGWACKSFPVGKSLDDRAKKIIAFALKALKSSQLFLIKHFFSSSLSPIIFSDFWHGKIFLSHAKYCNEVITYACAASAKCKKRK